MTADTSVVGGIFTNIRRKNHTVMHKKKSGKNEIGRGEMKQLTIKHAIITPVCRGNRGDMGAFEEAVQRLREQYIQTLNAYEDMSFIKNFHLKLDVEFEERENEGG